MAGKTKRSSGAQPPRVTDLKRQKIKEVLEKDDTTFDDIFEVYLRKTPFARSIGLQKSQLDERLLDYGKFTFEDAINMSTTYNNADLELVARFIARQIRQRRAPVVRKTKNT